MTYKDSLTLLAEAADFDIANSAETAINESSILSTYEDIDEINEEVSYPAEMVPVVGIDGEAFTEMQYLAPFMTNNDITSVEEALDILAEVNNLPAKGVGLLVESQECVTDKINEALGKSKKAHKNILDKIARGEKLTGKLKKDGYKVKKKKSSKHKSAKSKRKYITKEGKQVCPECGKYPCECGNVEENSKKVCKECGKYPCECGSVKEAALFGFDVNFK